MPKITRRLSALHATSRSSNSPIAPAVVFESVTKSYGGSPVVGPVTLVVHPGETVALVGPSGAGKTTLLSVAAGTLVPTQGTIELHGRDVTRMRSGAERSQLVGIVAQQFDLVPNLSALHNVLAGRLGAWSLWRALISLLYPLDRQLALDTLDRVGVKDRARLRAGRLSGGEQQRVAIARVLIQDPAILLADEPVASLDPARAQEVLRLLVGLTRETGKTLVASIHAVELARAHFDRIVGLRNGMVLFDVPADEVDEDMLRELYDLRGLRVGA